MNKKFSTVDEYFNELPAKSVTLLFKLRALIKQAAPLASEKISYNMPAFELNGNLVYYAAFKNHISLFPHPTAIRFFKNDLQKYKTSKGTIQFSLDKPLPVKLIKNIIKYRVSEKLNTLKNKPANKREINKAAVVNSKKKKMQNVNFKSVDEFLDFLPDNELKIVEYLRFLVLECIPGCTEKLSYNVPFYKRKSTICFIWPGSVKWGNKGHAGVRFGFTKGYLLNDELNFLNKGDRKQVYWKDFQSINEIDTDTIKMLLFEALEIDSNFKS